MGIGVREWPRDWAWGTVAGDSRLQGVRAIVVRSVLRLGTPEVEVVLYRRLSKWWGEMNWGEASLR